MSWAESEVSYEALGDPRRARRLSHILTARSEGPCESFSSNFGGASELNKFYQFCDNRHISREGILAGHREATVRRMSEETVVLAVQDSMEYDVSTHPEAQGFGPLQGKHRQGAWLHQTLAVTPKREVLGVLDQQIWYRGAQGKKASRRERPIEAKESHKWLVALEATAAASVGLSTRVVSVGDSEADIYDLFYRAKILNQEVLVRACQNRLVDETAGKLWSHLASQAPAREVQVEVPRRRGHPGRTAHLTVRFASVQLKAPTSRASERLPVLSTWAVLAREEQPPAGVEAVEWLLLSTAPIETADQACERLQWYTCRWLIETFHKVLKSGCQIERRQFERADRVERYLAIDAIVAWRVLYLTMQGRSQPHLSAEVILEVEQWQALCCYIQRVPVAPESAPTLGEALIWIARLGGYLGRKSDGPPGVTVLWRGLQQLSTIVQMYQSLKQTPEQAKPS